MPIHLLWGDDAAARDRAIDALIGKVVDPSWSSLNLSRLDGADAGQALQALEEARTPPFATGERLVLLQRSPFCNGCPSELADRFEAALELIPDSSHLVLVNPAKPDGRLRTTKTLQKRIKSGLDHEQSFPLPAAWDGNGQRQLVQRTAEALGLKVEPDAIDALVEAIGTDSARLESELRKLSLRDTSISAARVQELVGGRSTNALAVGDALLEGNPGEAIARWDALIEAGEARIAVSDASARITNDPTRLEEVEGRLFTLRSLARKHDTTCDGLPNLLLDMDEKLSTIHGGNDRMAELEAAVKESDTAYEQAARAVSDARQAAAGRLDEMVNQELPPLKLDGGKFSTLIERVTSDDGAAHGIDRISFVASTNPGMAPGPIAKIASGGELARFMLALKVSLAAEGHGGTLIFDEVDAGVGGAVLSLRGAAGADLPSGAVPVELGRVHARCRAGRRLCRGRFPYVAALPPRDHRADHSRAAPRLDDAGAGLVRLDASGSHGIFCLGGRKESGDRKRAGPQEARAPRAAGCPGPMIAVPADFFAGRQSIFRPVYENRRM